MKKLEGKISFKTLVVHPSQQEFPHQGLSRVSFGYCCILLQYGGRL